jgi:hypothetical protein
MTPEELAERHPRLFHVTTPGAWDSIRRFGLLSTEALLRAAGRPADEIERLTTRRRPARVVLDATALGRIVLNDNIPLSEKALEKCLTGGLKPAEWLRILNQRVFFWVGDARMQLLRDARANQADRREVLVFDTLGLVRHCAERVAIAPINTGSTLRAPAARGPDTFTPLGAMTYREWQRRRMPPNRSPDHIVEVTVSAGIPGIERYLVERREVVA